MIGLLDCFIIVTKRKDNMTLSVIIGSTRQGLFSEKPAKRHVDDLLWWTAALKTARER